MNDETMREQFGKEHWHLSKGISVSHIFVTLSVVASGFFYVDDIKDDGDLLKAEVEHIKQDQEKAIKDIKKDLDKANDGIKSVDEKLDGIKDYLIDRNGRQ